MKTKQQQNPKGSSIIRTFSEQNPSRDFVDELFPPTFESLFSSKKEVVNYEAPKKIIIITICSFTKRW